MRLANHSRRILLSAISSVSPSSHPATEWRAVYEFYQGGNDRMVAWWLEHVDDISVNDMVILMEKLITDIFDRLLTK